MSCKPSSTAATPKADGQKARDPHAPFVGSDLLEYENVLAKLRGEPAKCWRNEHIKELRRRRVPEAEIEAWARAYDGEDGVPSWQIPPRDTAERLERQIRANAARLSFHGDPFF